MRRFTLHVAALTLVALAIAGCHRAAVQKDASATGTETLVVLRHGEKVVVGLGQLNCQGLNRALALPSVLIGRFGRHAAIFAPAPAVQIRDGLLAWQHFSSIRPLTPYGQDPSTVPTWSDSDYDMLYVFKITTATGQQPALSFSAQQERAHRNPAVHLSHRGLAQRRPFPRVLIAVRARDRAAAPEDPFLIARRFRQLRSAGRA